jgi:integrase
VARAGTRWKAQATAHRRWLSRSVRAKGRCITAIAALQRDSNRAGGRQGTSAITFRELFDHYRQRELGNGNTLLLPALAARERTLVLLDACTGLRMSELFALKWSDVDFEAKQMDVRRSIVNQVFGSCKTEASPKPVPLDDRLAECLVAWRGETNYNRPDDWIFASPASRGSRPCWGQSIVCLEIIGGTRRKPSILFGVPDGI